MIDIQYVHPGNELGRIFVFLEVRSGRGVRHQEIHTFSLGNTKKKSGNALKYQEIPVNFRKYY
jgi:hypothetical protein